MNPTINQGVVTYNVIVDTTNEGQLLKPGMTAQVSFVAAQRDDVVRVPTTALRFKPPKDDKKDDKKDNKKDDKKDDADAKKKAEAVKAESKSTEPNTASAPNAKLAAPIETRASGAGGRRGVGTVYKLNDKNELVAVSVRTGVASNQHTELLDGDVKPGDKLVIRDLLDRAKK